ncbi:MAG TPA: group I intron-associated PD-(D/E)XK endonuclease [Candidatus Sulfotelmatobacter sp.]|nr:group I intron-associated PD-(D/E)XK endonuclease [Candidatus Sulfotelmatobacter sp.]
MGEVVSLLDAPQLFADEPARARPDASAKRKRDTKSVGDISEARVLTALMEAGYVVSRPFGENQRYDLVIDDGQRLYRVQVKTGRLRGAVIAYSCSSSHAHRNGVQRPYFGEIDYLAVYCPQTRKVYLLPEQEFVATAAHLRVSPARNNMVKGIRWASRFELP